MYSNDGFYFEIEPENGENGLWISRAIGGILCLGNRKEGDFAFDWHAIGITPEKALQIAAKLTEWANDQLQKTKGK